MPKRSLLILLQRTDSDESLGALFVIQPVGDGSLTLPSVSSSSRNEYAEIAANSVSPSK
jgi:hypothetical protein